MGKTNRVKKRMRKREIKRINGVAKARELKLEEIMNEKKRPVLKKTELSVTQPPNNLPIQEKKPELALTAEAKMIDEKFKRNRIIAANVFKNKNPDNKTQLPVDRQFPSNLGFDFNPDIFTLKDVQRVRTLSKVNNAINAKKMSSQVSSFYQEAAGFIEPDAGETVNDLTQERIVANVDITTATKYFNLHLDHGPYSFRYLRNGRHLLLGGRKGHVAAFDWLTKKLACEINVMEEIFDVQWLHIETMFAVAQRNFVHIYSNQGVELHCLQRLNRITKMTFLPHHFLLATGNDEGILSWLDISYGKLVARTKTHQLFSTLTPNYYNGLICMGQRNGTVSMWSPNEPKSLVDVKCHGNGIQSLAIDDSGRFMVTSALSNEVKVWDIRHFHGPLQHYKIRGTPRGTAISQKGYLALAFRKDLEIYKNYTTSLSEPYLIHKHLLGEINSIQFCPYEDVLGIGLSSGFASILVPGAGEPNFDSIEANPLQTVRQRQEREIHSLLEKIPSTHITLNPDIISKIKPTPHEEENINDIKELMEGGKEEKPEKLKIYLKRDSAKNIAFKVNAIKLAKDSLGALGRFVSKRELQAKAQTILKGAENAEAN